MPLRLPAFYFFIGGLLAVSGASAAPLTASVAALGLPASAVLQAFPGAAPVRAPARLSSGAVGLLRQAQGLCEGLPFAQTFYFNRDQLTQVEMTWLGDEGHGGHVAMNSASAFTALVKVISGRLGAELSTAASTATTVMESASWVEGNSSIVLFRSGKAERPVVRLVVRQRELVDGSTL